MFVLSDKAGRELSLTCLFGTFVFLQLTVLGLANHAGEGYLMHVRHVANRIAANTQNAIRKRAVARAFSKENPR